MLPTGALRISIEEKFGTLSYFFIYALLEWLIIILLFVDGFLAFLSNEIARLFELKTPCLLCTRLDHVLVQRDSNFYYNESICEVHKKDISTLTFCHLHNRLSDIRSMCQGCLLSFAADRDCDSDRHKSLVGILHMDVDCLVGDERKLQHLKQLKKYEVEIAANEKIGMLRCSCCGAPLRSTSSSVYSSSLSMVAPASPRAAWFSGRNDEAGSIDLLPSRYTELKLTVDTDLVVLDEEDAPLVDSHGSEDMNHIIEDPPRTPHFTDRNKFFGIPLTDGASAESPKWGSKKADLVMDEGEGEGEDIVARLKRQLTHDRRSLMALYMELDEERSASAVAANNAMAMITRLQEEKAAVQMEALQYQRMMEEQAEYDQEALQMMKDMLFKREEEMKGLEFELEQYKEKFGVIKNAGSDICEVDLDEGYQQDIITNSQALSPLPSDDDELALLDYERERCYLLGLLKEVEAKMCCSSSPLEKDGVAREVSSIRERLKAVEAESGFLKQAAITLQRGGEGIKVLSEIAQHLRQIRLRSLSLQDKDASSLLD